MIYAKDDLLRIAYLNISDSNYSVDIAALRGFCLGAGIHPMGLTKWLQDQLCEDYPSELPDNWLYAQGDGI